MIKTLIEMKRKDDIEFKNFSDQVNYRLKEFEMKNIKRMRELENQRELDRKKIQQQSLWANTIKKGKF